MLTDILDRGGGIGAEWFARDLLARVESIKGPDALEVAQVLDLLLRPGPGLPEIRAREKRAMAERAVAIKERTLGPVHPELETSLSNLGVLLIIGGDPAAAKPLLERVLAIREAAFGPDHSLVGEALHSLGWLALIMDDDDRAKVLLERAQRIQEATLGAGHPHTIQTVVNLAKLYQRTGDYAAARPLFERVLDSQERFLRPTPLVVDHAFRLGDVLMRLGEYEAARRLYERTLESLAAYHPRIADAMVNLARLHLAIGSYQEAGTLLDRAQTIQEKTLGPAHPALAITLLSRAEVAVGSGAPTQAFEIAARAEALSRKHLRLTLRTLPERQALAASASPRTPTLDLMLHLASARRDDEAMSRAAWEAVIRSRGMVLDEMAARDRFVAAGEGLESAGLAEALTSARQRLAALTVRGIRNDPPELYRRLLEEARDEKDRTERAVIYRRLRILEQARDEQDRDRILLPEISAALPPASALVGFVMYGGEDAAHNTTALSRLADEPAYLAFVLRADGSPVVIPLGTATRIDRLVSQWRQQLDREAMAAGRVSPQAEAAYRRVAGALREMIWDPLRPHLTSARRVFIVPDGALHLVNFAALPTGASRYLIETGPVIHYLSTERDVVPADAARAAERSLLALGDPAYDATQVASAVSKAPFLGTRSACPEFESMRFESLPASLQEVNDILTIWNQAHGARAATRPRNASPPDAVRLTGAAASESAFKSEAPRHQILHVAAHGFFLGGRCASALDRAAPFTAAGASAKIARENPLLLSGLVLAGANHRDAAPPGDEDGVLTAEEVATLNLSGVEWAVLSGCDTGVGEVRVGEGVFGLRRAFQIAGARTVIMSLWSVEDQVTRQWMRHLYSNRLIKRLTTTGAVREASLALLRQRRAKGLSAHPFHWAAFVAAGDWR
jgi:CHAT domain-containing protein